MSRLSIKVDSDKSSQTFVCNATAWYYLFKDANCIHVSASVNGSHVKLSIPQQDFEKLFSSVNSSAFGNYIKGRMIELGYSQHDLAFRCGISQMSLSKIIRGVTRGVNTETIAKLSIGLGVSEDELKHLLSK
jgi:DNA-binding Xre family transcriptional regulator